MTTKSSVDITAPCCLRLHDPSGQIGLGVQEQRTETELRHAVSFPRLIIPTFCLHHTESHATAEYAGTPS